MKYTQIPNDTFKCRLMNAGIIVEEFDPDTRVYSGILGATSGGVSFAANNETIDDGENIDGCPKNTMELKRGKSWEAKLSGTFVTVTPKLAAKLVASGEAEQGSSSKIVPKGSLSSDDFFDLWWVSDYSDINEDGDGDGKAGFVAICLRNALSTGGISIQGTDEEAAKFPFEFTAHYSIQNPDVPPYEIHIVSGTED